jgi:hypothetical protein
LSPITDHSLLVYANLARAMALTGLDQLWVANIACVGVCLPGGDSRRVFTTGDRLGAGSRADASAAAHGGRPAPRLVHHSDRGVQYAGTDYT